MESLNKFEVTVASWYKNAPHLPEQARKWLAENVWWIVFIGVALGVLGIIGFISVTFLAGALLIGFAGAAGAAVAGLALIGAVAYLIFSIISIIIGSVAIMPLKNRAKKGWSLLFLLVLIEALSFVLGFVFNPNLLGLIWQLLWAAVGAYFLFEIRDLFGTTRSAKKAETVKKA